MCHRFQHWKSGHQLLGLPFFCNAICNLPLQQDEDDGNDRFGANTYSSVRSAFEKQSRPIVEQQEYTVQGAMRTRWPLRVPWVRSWALGLWRRERVVATHKKPSVRTLGSACSGVEGGGGEICLSAQEVGWWALPGASITGSLLLLATYYLVRLTTITFQSAAVDLLSSFPIYIQYWVKLRVEAECWNRRQFPTLFFQFMTRACL